jgi:hypothetical protein
MSRRLIAAALACGLLFGSTAARAGDIDCKLRFSMAGWSVFYKTASGEGTITCDNGQSMHVSINAKGGGLTFGKSRIEDGTGEFSGVSDIKDLLGT